MTSGFLEMWYTVNWIEVFFTTLFFLIIQRYIWNKNLERHLDEIENLVKYKIKHKIIESKKKKEWAEKEKKGIFNLDPYLERLRNRKNE